MILKKNYKLKMLSILLLLFSFGLFPEIEAAQSEPVKMSVEYRYAADGVLLGRTVNGTVQNFEYDMRGQLLAVKEADGRDIERYVYDPAGNILSKTVNGKTTRFTYDAANQIKSRTNSDGSVVYYQYDAAGRLISEGNRTYHYSYQDKVEEIRENGKTIAKFTYGLDGQLETVTQNKGTVECFYWDGLALIGRGESTFINEPYVTGGNPIASDGKVMLNDMLGNTLAVNGNPVQMTSFGETDNRAAFFTGKPMIDELGYAFLFRNYNPNLGKWTTADPLGYPDGWNNLAYCNNKTNYSIDIFGLDVWEFYVCQRPIESNSNQQTFMHTWIEAVNQTKNETKSYSGFMEEQNNRYLNLYVNESVDRGQSIQSFKLDTTNLNGDTIASKLETFVQKYKNNTVLYGATTLLPSNYNSNSMTSTMLLYMGFRYDTIPQADSQLHGFRVGLAWIIPRKYYE